MSESNVKAKLELCKYYFSSNLKIREAQSTKQKETLDWSVRKFNRKSSKCKWRKTENSQRWNCKVCNIIGLSNVEVILSWMNVCSCDFDWPSESCINYVVMFPNKQIICKNAKKHRICNTLKCCFVCQYKFGRNYHIIIVIEIENNSEL